MRVAIALIMDKQQRFLVTQRPLHVSHGGYWEFPGGKIEKNESAEQALVREIKEEVGLEVHNFKLLSTIDYNYPDRFIQLAVFHVIDFTGNPCCLEGQLNLQWIKKENLKPEKFPAANHAIFDIILNLSNKLL